MTVHPIPGFALRATGRALGSCIAYNAPRYRVICDIWSTLLTTVSRQEDDMK